MLTKRKSLQLRIKRLQTLINWGLTILENTQYLPKTGGKKKRTFTEVGGFFALIFTFFTYLNNNDSGRAFLADYGQSSVIFGLRM